MIENLQWLAQSDKGWAAQRATWALELTRQFEIGEISISEYQELMSDLVRSDRLDEEADDMEVKNMLVASIMIVGKLA
jgi:hypothetical protein